MKTQIENQIFFIRPKEYRDDFYRTVALRCQDDLLELQRKAGARDHRGKPAN